MQLVFKKALDRRFAGERLAGQRDEVQDRVSLNRPADIAASQGGLMDTTYSGNCFCGSVRFRVSGAPAAMGYCHCDSCRHWSAGPVNAFTLWSPDALNVTDGEEEIGTYHLTENSYRKWCKRCGGHLFTEHPGMKLVDIYAALLPELTFTPALHVNYTQTVLPMKDGLPKFRDFPKEVGGSGETIPE